MHALVAVLMCSVLWLCPIMVEAGTGVGKALALDTPIATPSGWSRMGELSVGSAVFDERGVPEGEAGGRQAGREAAQHGALAADGAGGACGRGRPARVPASGRALTAGIKSGSRAFTPSERRTRAAANRRG